MNWIHDIFFCYLSCLLQINNINVFCLLMLTHHLYFHKLLYKCCPENDIWFCWISLFGFSRNFQLIMLCYYIYIYIIYQKIVTRLQGPASSVVFLLQVAVVDVLLICSHIFCHFLFGPHRDSNNPIWAIFLYCYDRRMR